MLMNSQTYILNNSYTPKLQDLPTTSKEFNPNHFSFPGFHTNLICMWQFIRAVPFECGQYKKQDICIYWHLRKTLKISYNNLANWSFQKDCATFHDNSKKIKYDGKNPIVITYMHKLSIEYLREREIFVINLSKGIYTGLI